MKIIAQNRKAYFNYTIEEEIEAGLVLLGSEVKALRDGRVNINDAYVAETDEGLFLVNLIIGAYKGAAIFTHDEKRPRKILMHKKETHKLIGKMRVKGYSLIPTKIFLHLKLVLVLLDGRYVILDIEQKHYLMILVVLPLMEIIEFVSQQYA